MAHGDYRTEFPDFDPATMPWIPVGFSDTSWGAETCPSFLNEELGLCLCVDYADTEKREFPDCPRFSLHRWEDGCAYVLASGDDFDAIVTVITVFRGEITIEAGDETISTPMSEFISNNDGVEPEEWETMVATLARGESYVGGGGAAAEFTLRKAA